MNYYNQNNNNIFKADDLIYFKQKIIKDFLRLNYEHFSNTIDNNDENNNDENNNDENNNDDTAVILSNDYDNYDKNTYSSISRW